MSNYDLDVVDFVHREAFMKAGATPNDVVAIQKGFAEGKTAQQISQELLVKVECVASFAPVKVEEKSASVPKGAEAFAGVTRGKRK